MTPRRLRTIIRRFGPLGLVFVAAYLGFLPLWEKRRPTAVTFCLLLCFLSLVLFHHRTRLPHHHARPVVFVAVSRPLCASTELSSVQLLKRATKVMDIKGYWDWDGGYSEYRWLSNHELFYAQYTGEGPNRIETPRLFRYNLNTHVKTELRRLERLTGSFYHSRMEVSPDGKWLLWHGGNADMDTLDAATLDGSRHLQWPSGYWEHHVPAWMKDSRHWIEFRRESSDAPITQAVIHSVTAPQKNVVLSVPLNSLGDGVFPNIAVHDRLISVSEPERGDAQRQIKVGEASLYPSISPVGQHNVLLPSTLSNPNIAVCCLSPHGDKVALVVGDDTPMQNRDTNQRLYGLWVCHPDGSHSREVGTWQKEENPNRILELDGLRWLPSGKGLSFVYRGTLWLIGNAAFAGS